MVRKVWLRRAVVALLVALALVPLAGVAAALGLYLWLRVPPLPYDTDEAVALYTRVLNGEDALRVRGLRALAGAVSRAPEDPRARLWFGLANLHGYLETRELAYAVRTTRALDRAVELDPDNGSAEGWRAFFAYMAARRGGGQDVAEAAAALRRAGDADPRFTPFLVAVALARQPLETGLPEAVLRPLEAIEDCGDGTSHRCRTGPLFPHGAEGYHATVGDLRVRLGDVEGGRAAYRQALAMESARTWPYRAAFVEWTRGAERRARLLTNEDPEDDPPIFFASGPRACAACHER